MNVVFRTDASTALGSGHVTRCLTLAETLRAHGARVCFVCRSGEGDLSDSIAARGFIVLRLAVAASDESERSASCAPLGAGWQEDATQTQAAIHAAGEEPDWLVVDHYALDRRWELVLRSLSRRIMVIDDLADRPHDCDLLLDQNFDNPLHARYTRLLPADARTLLGAQFALVRPEFARHRPSALARRSGQLRRVLVSMGGTDPIRLWHWLGLRGRQRTGSHSMWSSARAIRTGRRFAGRVRTFRRLSFIFKPRAWRS
jgi:UDP-2,4-diacetamido-2,4,6-trideoxy-beta-L-altropyranose hydrolase